MKGEKTVTVEELIQLIHSQEKEFMIHVKPEGEDAGNEKRNIPT